MLGRDQLDREKGGLKVEWIFFLIYFELIVAGCGKHAPSDHMSEFLVVTPRYIGIKKQGPACSPHLVDCRTESLFWVPYGVEEDGVFKRSEPYLEPNPIACNLTHLFHRTLS